MTTPDPLSAAVEAYDASMYAKDVRTTWPERQPAALSAAITAYIQASGMVLLPAPAKGWVWTQQPESEVAAWSPAPAVEAG